MTDVPVNVTANKKRAGHPLTHPLTGPGWTSNERLDMTPRYHDYMTKQTTVRLPEELADEAEAIARVKGTSVNQLIVDSLAAEIDRVRADGDFTSRAKRLLARDKELLDRLAR